MQNFNYYNPTEIIFGENQVKLQLKNKLEENGAKKVLLITGGGSIKKNSLYSDVKNALENSDIELFEFFGIEPNPTTTNIRDAVKIIKENGIDFLLSCGGGSSLDATKAISRAACIDSDIWDIFENKVSSHGTHIKFASIITIPATGSEANAGAVITNDQSNEKRPMNFVHPIFSICDPRYTFTLPNFQTGAGASDIVSHIFEQYFSEHDALITHEFMFSILRILKNAVPKVLENPQNYDLRSEIMYAGTLGLNYSLTNGVGAMSWDVHGIEHSLSGFYKITHGAGLAIITPTWLKEVAKDKRGEQLILKLGKNVFGVNNVLETIDEVKKMFISFGMPQTLTQLGVDDSKFEQCAQDVINAWGNDFGIFTKWNKEKVLQLYKDILN